MKVIFKILILIVIIFVIIEEIHSCHLKNKRKTTTTTRVTSTTTRINDGSGNIDPRVGNPGGNQNIQTTTGFAFRPIS
jgi:hypothetical protein